MSIQQAKIYITNTSDGNAIIRLHHNNSSNGTQSDSWDAAPGETVGPLTVEFETGIEAYCIMDYWWISLSVRDGSNPGEYASSEFDLSEWKECQLQSKDAGQSMTFTVNTTTFTLNEKSGSCTDSMVKIASYSPITNVFVLMLENHSFDNMFAMSGISGITAATINNSNSYNGKPIML
jgi:phospholipase C